VSLDTFRVDYDTTLVLNYYVSVILDGILLRGLSDHGAVERTADELRAIRTRQWQEKTARLRQLAREGKHR
jgi:hypothetical protein